MLTVNFVKFPEAARILMLKGAELILVPNACPMEITEHIEV
jgi:hydrolase, carbon-nitrogen family